MRPILSALAVAALVAAAVPAVAGADVCANRLCTKYEKGTKSCWNKGGRKAIARCFIYRASHHYGESTGLALTIARRESRFDWRVTNSSSGAAGLFQFMPGTWRSTPYRRKSPYNPKWSSLAAMWMWKRGLHGHWSTMY